MEWNGTTVISRDACQIGINKMSMHEHMMGFIAIIWNNES